MFWPEYSYCRNVEEIGIRQTNDEIDLSRALSTTEKTMGAMNTFASYVGFEGNR